MYPAVHPVSPREIREAASGEAAARRRGRGHDLYNLRAYRAGDEPHLIHWPTTRQVGQPDGPGARGGHDRGHADRAHRDGRGGRGAPRAGAVGGGVARASTSSAAAPAWSWRARPGSCRSVAGRGQERRILTALALYAPPGPGDAASRGRGRRAAGDPHQPGPGLMTMPLVLRIALYLLVADGLFALYLAEFLGLRGVAPGGGAARGGLARPAPRARRGRAAAGRAGSSCRWPRWPRWWTSPISRRTSSTPWSGSCSSWSSTSSRRSRACGIHATVAFLAFFMLVASSGSAFGVGIPLRVRRLRRRC